VIPPLIERHAEKLKRVHAGVELKELPTNQVQAVIIEVPDVELPPGWNKSRTTIRFLVPLAYPAAPPDCFWADADLALHGGRAPQGSGRQPIPGLPDPLLWFSWHVQQWDPNRHTLASFFQVVKDRLWKAL
jgi:hypothetical protein